MDKKDAHSQLSMCEMADLMTLKQEILPNIVIEPDQKLNSYEMD
jgi:hypothetical protein